MELRTLKIYNHLIAAVTEDVAWLRVTLKNVKSVHCLEYRADRIDGVQLVDLVTAVEQGPSGPAEKHDVHIDTAVVMLWPDQVYTAEAYGNMLPLDGTETVVHIDLVL